MENLPTMNEAVPPISSGTSYIILLYQKYEWFSIFFLLVLRGWAGVVVSSFWPLHPNWCIHRLTWQGNDDKKQQQEATSNNTGWLVVSTPLKNISQNGNLPQVGVKIENIWNHHLEQHRCLDGMFLGSSHTEPQFRWLWMSRVRIPATVIWLAVEPPIWNIYARQIGSFPQGFGVKIRKLRNSWDATT